MIRLLVFPQATNPYQSLLYTPIRNKLKVIYSKPTKWSFCTYPILLLSERLNGTRLIHLHWLYWLTVPFPEIKLQQKLSGLNIRMFILLSKILGFKIVWTVHNVFPHEKQTNNDRVISRLISEKSTAKIVHSNYVKEQMQLNGLDIDNIHVIPHGNYIGSYPNRLSRKESRFNLGISSQANALVVLFFGLIRPYKGIEDLLDAFQHSLYYKNTHVKLIIAGSCEDPQLKLLIETAAKASNIDFYNGFVEDGDVQTFFNACDVVCLPFKSITTSGSALLALSFGKAIIAPLAGALTDLPQNVGYLYDNSKSNSLAATIQLAIEEKHKLSEMGRFAREYAKTLDWNAIANKTYDLYENILSNDNP